MSNTEWMAFEAMINAEDSKIAARRKFERANAIKREAERREEEAKRQYIEAHRMQQMIAGYYGNEPKIEPVYRDYERLDQAYAHRTGETYDDDLDGWNALGKIAAAAKRIINDRSRW